MSDFMDSAGRQKLVQLLPDGAVPVTDVSDDPGDASDRIEELLGAILLEMTAIRMAMTELVNQGNDVQYDFVEQASDYIETPAEEN